MMHFLCIKWGNKYSGEYVNNLRKMVQQNYTKKRHKFICYTDDPDGIDKGITIRSIPKVDPLHPDYWFEKTTVGIGQNFSFLTLIIGCEPRSHSVILI